MTAFFLSGRNLFQGFFRCALTSLVKNGSILILSRGFFVKRYLLDDKRLPLWHLELQQIVLSFRSCSVSWFGDL